LFYCKNHEVLAVALSEDTNFSPGKNSFEFEYETYMEEIKLKQTSDVSVSIFSPACTPLISLDYIAAFETPEFTVYPLDLKLTDVVSRYVLAWRIAYGKFNTLRTYDIFTKELIVLNIRLKILTN